MNIKIRKNNKIIYKLKNIKIIPQYGPYFEVEILGYTKNFNNIENTMDYFKIEDKGVPKQMIYDFKFENNIITLFITKEIGFCRIHSQKIIPDNHKNLLKKLLEIK